MSILDFLAAVESIIALRPTYRIGGSGRDGTCDCIGLIMWALRLLGYRWTGDHSSNWAPRRAMASLRDVHSVADLAPGDWVYKYRVPGDPKYRLPARFAGGPDLRDYYHVGVVMSVAPLKIAHCTSGGGVSGILIDTKLGQWRAAGQGKMIAAGKPQEGEAPMQKVSKTMTVTAEQGSTVNLRPGPSTKGDLVLEYVSIGTEVQVHEEAGGWAKVTTPAGKTGYMMTKYLTAAKDTPPDVAPALPVDAQAMLAELSGLLERARAIVQTIRAVG